MKCSVHKLLRWSWKIVMAGLVLPFSAPTKAEVTLDGTLGPAGSLTGLNFVIPDTVGQTVGTNLFHSFGLFSINTGESATFTGPAAIDNVISRVTGGSQSFIDGLLRSEIQSANLWFINPAGVLFGQHASLDIQGSFHVSTADYLKLGEGGRFDATHPENSVLTTAPPEAFGFLGERQPAGIAVQGSLLQVPDGETLSVVGGDIRIADGTLYAPGGRIDMVSVASPGEVLPNAPDLGVASFERLGRIEVSHSSSERPLVDPSLPPEALGNAAVIGNVDTSGEGGGSVFIRGGQFVMDNSFVASDTLGSGDGGDITVKADSLHLKEGAQISAATFGSGSSGNVAVEAEDIVLREGTQISAATFGPGDGGNVAVEAEDIVLEGGFFLEDFLGNEIILPSGLFVGSTLDSGDAGDILVKAGRLRLREGAHISAATSGSGSGGDVEVNAGDLQVSDGATINAGTSGPGRGGNIIIDAMNINLSDGGSISVESLGTGRSGNIFIRASDTFRLFSDSRVSVETGLADAGDITLDIGFLLHLRDSSITSSVAGGTGDGGDITLNSVFFVLDEGSSIIANALEGQGGNILIRIRGGGALFQSPDSLIEASSEFGISRDAPDTDIIAGFSRLPANFLDAATVLTQLCTERSGANVSSLVVRRYEVLPDSPYALRVQLPRAMPAPRTAKQSRAPRTYRFVK